MSHLGVAQCTIAGIQENVNNLLPLLDIEKYNLFSATAMIERGMTIACTYRGM